MVDILIKFETAKLAKEKGFDLFTRYGFNIKGQQCFYSPLLYNGLGEPQGYKYWNHSLYEGQYFAQSTQTLLQKWLRENKQIYVQPILVEQLNPESGWGYELTYLDEGEFSNTDEDINYSTYEKALEAGLIKALKLIKNK